MRIGIIGRDGPTASPAGALVVRADRSPMIGSCAGIPCSFLGRYLCVPSEASLHPPLSATEANALCTQALVFLHPTLGTFAFNDADLCTLSDLLEPPPIRNANWNQARVHDQLLHSRCDIEFVRPDPSDQNQWESLFGKDPQEIGGAPPSDLAREAKMAKGAEESGSLGPKILDGIAQGVVKATRLVSGSVPGTGAGWIDRMRGWALDRLGRDGVPNPREDELHRLRERELELLAQQLQDNPDIGLQHAIPLTPQPYRGISAPGTKLPARSTDYASGHDGSRAGDVWNLGETTHSKLRKIYFDLANREIVLGRFRRAAYIYAHLLGDYSSAANALIQGRCFREAAEIYETRLGNPLQAARCLLEGGLLREALERFEKLGQILEVATLHEKLGEPEAAAKLWRQLVDESLRAGDRIHAAQLLESRLRAPEEAERVLREGWPHSLQAVRCLEAEAELLDRIPADRRLISLVEKAREGPWRIDQVVSVVRLMNQIAKHSKSEAVSTLAEDASRLLASDRLQSPDLPLAEATLITEALALDWARDPLLSRDLSRYLQRRQIAQLLASRATQSPDTDKTHTNASAQRVPRRSLDFTLPTAFEWFAVEQEASWFFALGFNSARAVAVRGTWGGDLQSISLRCESVRDLQHLSILPTHEGGSRLMTVDTRSGGISAQSFPIQDLFFSVECRLETPSWLPTPNAAVAFEPGGAWTLHIAEGRSILSSFSHEGRLQRTVDLSDLLPAELWDLWRGRPSLQASDDGVAIALGRYLLFVSREGESTQVKLESDFVRFARSLPGQHRRIGLCLKDRLELFCPLRKTTLSLTDLESPHAAWLSTTSLMVVSDGNARQFELVEDTSEPLRETVNFATSTSDVLALLPTPEGRVAFFSKNGRVAIWNPAS